MFKFSAFWVPNQKQDAIVYGWLVYEDTIEKEVHLNLLQNQQSTITPDVSEYVAHLQLHMALQARNLVPTLTTKSKDTREQLLQQTQADIEKQVSRQMVSLGKI